MKLSNTRGWDLKRAMRNLEVEHEEFDRKMRRKAAGYSYSDPRNGKTYLALNPDGRQEDRYGTLQPVAQEMVAFHELGHIVLNHGKMTAVMAVLALAKDIPELGHAFHDAHEPAFEVDAMKVALAVAQRLGIPDEEANYDSIRFYIESFEESVFDSPLYSLKSDQEIARAAETIIEAGL